MFVLATLLRYKEHGDTLISDACRQHLLRIIAMTVQHWYALPLSTPHVAPAV